MRAKLTKHRRFARRIHRTRSRRPSVTRATFSASGTRPGRPWPSKYFEWIKTFLISGNCRYPEQHGGDARHAPPTALVPFLRGDYEKESTTACSSAACSCWVFGRRLRSCRTGHKPNGACAIGNNGFNRSVRDTADTPAANHRTILAHGRIHHVERDQGPARAHMHRRRRRVVELHGEPGQYLGYGQDLYRCRCGDRGGRRSGPHPHHGNCPGREIG